MWWQELILRISTLAWPIPPGHCSFCAWPSPTCTSLWVLSRFFCRVRLYTRHLAEDTWSSTCWSWNFQVIKSFWQTYLWFYSTIRSICSQMSSCRWESSLTMILLCSERRYESQNLPDDYVLPLAEEIKAWELSQSSPMEQITVFVSFGRHFSIWFSSVFRTVFDFPSQYPCFSLPQAYVFDCVGHEGCNEYFGDRVECSY